MYVRISKKCHLITYFFPYWGLEVRMKHKSFSTRFYFSLDSHLLNSDKHFLERDQFVKFVKWNRDNMVHMYETLKRLSKRRFLVRYFNFAYWDLDVIVNSLNFANSLKGLLGYQRFLGVGGIHTWREVLIHSFLVFSYPH